MGASHATERSGPHGGVPAENKAHILVDQRGTVVGWSSEAEGLLGCPADAMLGRPALDLLAGADPNRSQERGPLPSPSPGSFTSPRHAGAVRAGAQGVR
ncbi:PAS domain-containing protein [Streptomyces sp. NPDC127197]